MEKGKQKRDRPKPVPTPMRRKSSRRSPAPESLYTPRGLAGAHHALTPIAALASFAFAASAFGSDAQEGTLTRLFSEKPVIAKAVGTPGFACALSADGETVADFSVGPAARSFSTVSANLSRRNSRFALFLPAGSAE
jgi:hypothetical protein